MSVDDLPAVPGYRIEAQMAEGGMGVVYRAVDDTLGRPVAIKMIRRALLKQHDEEEETVARFLREARAAAQIRSNHVAHVLQFGQTEAGDLYLVLEYLDGQTLTDVLRRDKQLEVPRAVRIIRQVCRGMEAAHHLGIVHRDLKPSNVMLVDQDGDREFVKILDFGVAKVVGEMESGVTRAGMLVGTYTCMAPEQVAGEAVDARTDIYALAVLLYRLLTGKQLFDGKDATAVLYHHVHTRPSPPSKAAPNANIPPALDALLLRCLEKSPGRRVRSMAELDRALGLALEMGDESDLALAQAPTAAVDPSAHTVSSSPRLDMAGHDRSATVEEVENGEEEVVVDSGALAVADAPTRTSGARRPADPPTPGTATRAGLLAGEGSPPGEVERGGSARSSRPVVIAAAAVGGLLLLAALAAALVLRGGDDEPQDVIVEAVRSAVEPSTEQPEEPTEPPEEPTEQPEEPTEPAEPAEQELPSDGEEEPPGAANAAVKPARTTPRAQPPREKPSAERVQWKRKRPARTTERPAAAAPPKSGDESAKRRPRFIRVRTGEDE